MIRSVPPLFALARAGCATTAMTGEAPPATLAVPVVPEAAMRAVVAELSSDRFEGRAPGTPAEDRTITAIVDRFKAAGLQPGNKGQWFQEAPTVEITAGNASPLKVTGGKVPLSFAYGSEYVAGSYRVTPRTRLADSEMVFVGYGVVEPGRGARRGARCSLR